MKTYLVTGGAGFIGSNFILHLLKQDADISVLNVDALTYAGDLDNLREICKAPRYHFYQADVCDPAAIAEIFSRHSIDYVVHFAAESHVDNSIADPSPFIRTNVTGTVNLLNQAMRSWKRGDDCFQDGARYLQISTDEVYGALGKTGFFTEKTPLDPHSPYSASKASADLIVKAYFDTYRFPAMITRCSNNYGPRQFPEKYIPLLIERALKKDPLPIYGDGLQVRDWLHVSDHCRAIDLVLHHGVCGEIYNIGGDNERTNLSIANEIITILKDFDSSISDALITHVTDRKGHDRRYAIDHTKITRELNWRPLVSFTDGLRQTADWYIHKHSRHLAGV